MPLPQRGCNITQSTCDALSRTGDVSLPRPRCSNSCCYNKPHRAGSQRRVDIESSTLFSSALIRETTASLQYNTTQHIAAGSTILSTFGPPDRLRLSRSPHRLRWLERVLAHLYFSSSTLLVLYCDSISYTALLLILCNTLDTFSSFAYFFLFLFFYYYFILAFMHIYSTSMEGGWGQTSSDD